MTNDPIQNPEGNGFLDKCWLRLNSGRMVKLYRLNQSLTYAGMIEGVPNKSLNDDIVSASLSQAKKLGDAAVILIPPQRQKIPVEQFGYYQKDRERLPAIQCTGQFESWEPAQDSSMDCSSLTVVWFQEEYGLPTQPEILQQLRIVNWNKFARDGHF